VKKRPDSRGSWARSKQADTRIVPHPALLAKHARRRAWLRLVAATRSPADQALVEQHRARMAAHAAREAV
jgi:hypothetical protein